MKKSTPYIVILDIFLAEFPHFLEHLTDYTKKRSMLTDTALTMPMEIFISVNDDAL